MKGWTEVNWYALLADARSHVFLALVAVGLVFLASSPSKGTRHARWIAASSILFGTAFLLEAVVAHLSMSASALFILFTGAMAGEVIMCLSIGLDAYRNPALPTARQIAVKTALVPLGLAAFNAFLLVGLNHRGLTLAMGTVLLTLYPAWKAFQIYQTDHWRGHLVLIGALLLVPFSLLVAALAGLTLVEFRQLALYPASLALISAFALLQLRDAIERQQQMLELTQTRAQLQQLADSLERTVHERTEQLADMVAGLQSFNALVSHDLRGPLRNARGLVDVAANEIRCGLIDEGLETLKTVQRETRRGAEMVDDLLRLSSVEEATLRLSHADMASVFDHAVKALDPEYPAAREAIDVGAMPTIEMDEGLMQHVAINLLGNALKYGRYIAGLKIRVSAHKLPDGGWRFVIADNGPGFSPEHAARIFEPFMRVPGTREAGTGVGLAVVARVVHRHRGDVGASARVGEGATFWWTLPERQTPAVGEAGSTDGPASGAITTHPAPAPPAVASSRTIH